MLLLIQVPEISLLGIQSGGLFLEIQAKDSQIIDCDRLGVLKTF